MNTGGPITELGGESKLPLPIRSSAAHSAWKGDGWKLLLTGSLTVAQMACGVGDSSGGGIRWNGRCWTGGDDAACSPSDGQGGRALASALAIMG
jgi:hypothetical protein